MKLDSKLALLVLLVILMHRHLLTNRLAILNCNLFHCWLQHIPVSFGCTSYVAMQSEPPKIIGLLLRQPGYLNYFHYLTWSIQNYILLLGLSATHFDFCLFILFSFSIVSLLCILWGDMIYNEWPLVALIASALH